MIAPTGLDRTTSMLHSQRKPLLVSERITDALKSSIEIIRDALRSYPRG